MGEPFGGNTYFSTNVILSAISATLFAIREAMIAYADPTPFAGISPATDAALFITGEAFCCTGREIGPLGAFLAAFGLGRLTGTARPVVGAEGLRGITPLTCGRCPCADIFSHLKQQAGLGVVVKVGPCVFSSSEGSGGVVCECKSLSNFKSQGSKGALFKQIRNRVTKNSEEDLLTLWWLESSSWPLIRIIRRPGKRPRRLIALRQPAALLRETGMCQQGWRASASRTVAGIGPLVYRRMCTWLSVVASDAGYSVPEFRLSGIVRANLTSWKTKARCQNLIASNFDRSEVQTIWSPNQ